MINFQSKEFRHTQWHWHDADFDLDPESISMPLLEKLTNKLLTHPILNKEDEWCLFRRLNFVKYRIFMDDASYNSSMVTCIQNELIQRNLRFVAMLVGEKKIKSQDKLDLFQDAVLWMLDCIHLYNYKKGMRFVNYFSSAFHNNYSGWLKKRETLEQTFSELELFDIYDEKLEKITEQFENIELTEKFKKEIRSMLEVDFVLGTILMLRFGLFDDKIWKLNEIALVVKTSQQAVQKRIVNYLKNRK